MEVLTKNRKRKIKAKSPINHLNLLRQLRFRIEKVTLEGYDGLTCRLKPGDMILLSANGAALQPRVFVLILTDFTLSLRKTSTLTLDLVKEPGCARCGRQSRSGYMIWRKYLTVPPTYQNGRGTSETEQKHFCLERGRWSFCQFQADVNNT